VTVHIRAQLTLGGVYCLCVADSTDMCIRQHLQPLRVLGWSGALNQVIRHSTHPLSERRSETGVMRKRAEPGAAPHIALGIIAAISQPGPALRKCWH
jgi:hypothetical protein